MTVTRATETVATVFARLIIRIRDAEMASCNLPSASSVTTAIRIRMTTVTQSVSGRRLQSAETALWMRASSSVTAVRDRTRTRPMHGAGPTAHGNTAAMAYTMTSSRSVTTAITWMATAATRFVWWSVREHRTSREIWAAASRAAMTNSSSSRSRRPRRHRPVRVL